MNSTIVKFIFRFSCLWLAAAFLTVRSSAEIKAPQTPNIIIIYGDDIGYGDLGCYGAKAVKTPNVDRLAKEGLRFTSGYCSSATCTPSRFSILTGEYSFRQAGTGVLPGDAPLIIQPGRDTLPAVLKHAGYTTAAIGKWHLGLGARGRKINWNGEIKPGPLEIGFDDCFIIPATPDRVPCVYVQNHCVFNLDPADPLQVSYQKPFPGEPTGVTERQSLKQDTKGGHLGAVVNGISRIGFEIGGASALWKDDEMEETLAQQAVSFIETNAAHPFFLYYASHDIHVPRVPNARFVGQTTMGPRGDEIVEFDWATGQILDALDRLKLADNTLVILSSDNGPVLNDGYRDGAVEKVGDHKPAGPLRGGKYSLFEGGTCVPFIVRWPKAVKPGVSTAIISQVDLVATLAALTGQKIDTNSTPDSLNLLPALLGQSQSGRDEVVEYAQRTALRQGKWKYLTAGIVHDGPFPNKPVQVAAPGALYDLSTDLGETNDMSVAHPDIVKELSAKLAKIEDAGLSKPVSAQPVRSKFDPADPSE